MSNKSDYEYTKIIRFEKVLNDLFDNFIQDDGFICGGFARICLEEEDDFKDCSDIDIYCKNIEAFERIKERLLNNLYLEGKQSDVAISFRYAFEGKYPIQLIKPLNTGYLHTSDENIQEVLNNFDFTVVRAGIYRVKNENLIADEKEPKFILKALVDKSFFQDKNRLFIKNIHCPVAEFYRVAKYLRKGFTIKTSEVLKILMDWEQRPQSYKDNLYEKLTKEDPTQEEIDDLEKLLHVG